MRSRLWFVLCTGLMLPVLASGSACELAIGVAVRDGSRWHYALDLRTPGWHLAGVEAAEQGEDVVLELELGGHRTVSDVAPSRYAIERSSVIVRGPAKGRLSVRAFDVALERPPLLGALCAAPSDETFLPLLLWQGLVELIHRADTNRPDAGRVLARTLALAYADNFVAVARARGFDAKFVASALHASGYLASNAGRHADARKAYDQALTAWTQVPALKQAAAARFQIAAEELALGRAADALTTLRPLLTDDARRQFEPIWVWANNDRCVALRNLDRRDEAAHCFAQLVRIFDAANEPKEAANSLCNQASALGASGRWREAAPIFSGCAARRRTLGFPSGIAHAELLLGWQALETDSVEAAVTHFHRSAAAAQQSGEASRVWDAQRWLAQAWMDGDEVPKARAALEVLRSDEIQESSRSAQWHVAMGQLELLGDDRNAAADHLQQAAQGFEHVGQTTSLADVRCLQAMIEPDVDVEDNCDALIAAQALLARGENEAARARLRTELSARDRDVLRRFLLVISAQLAPTRQTLQPLVDEAATLPRDSPRLRSQRGQLLARLAYELARLSSDSSALSWLALDALWQAGESPAGFGRRISNAAVTERPGRFAQLPQRPQLKAGSVLVASTSFFGKGYLLIARTSGVETIAVDMPGVEAAVLTWRQQLVDGREKRQHAEAVASAIELARWWRDEDRRLLLAVHGPLSTLPWSALPVSGNAPQRMTYRPLVDQATIEYVANVGDVDAAVPRAIAPSIHFFPAKVDSSLPGTRVERQRISELAQGAGWTASIDEIRAGGVLHIAVHATADEISADNNRLLRPDGLGAPLSFPDELAREAGLVVLAGCETGLGPSSRWTLPSSLASHAVDAGAPIVLGHLWPVDDNASMRFHTNFYAALLRGHEPAAALRMAQLAQMQSLRQNEPRHWASAVLLIRRNRADAIAQTASPR